MSVNNGLGVPAAVQLGAELRSRGLNVPEDILTVDEMALWVMQQKEAMANV